MFLFLVIVSGYWSMVDSYRGEVLVKCFITTLCGKKNYSTDGKAKCALLGDLSSIQTGYNTDNFLTTQLAK